MISDFDRRTPVTTGPRPDQDAAQKAERFGLLCAGDIRRALTATYAHRADRDELLAVDLRTAVGLAVRAGHYGRVAIDQLCSQQRRSEGAQLLRTLGARR